MQQREKILFAGAIGALLLWAGLPKLNSIFVEPVTLAENRLAAVNKKIDDQALDVRRLELAGRTIQQSHGRSLPPNPLDAQRLYQVWLDDLANMSGIKDATVSPGRRIAARAKNVRGEVYTSVLVTLQGKATLENLSRFLHRFYRTDLEHRVVELNIDSPENRGNPELSISLTAEGLSFPSVKAKPTIFPQARLKQDFRSTSSAQQVEITAAKGFPEKPGFRIRIGDEYLTVTEVNGAQWSVRGGADQTRMERHRAGDLIELAPIHPRYASHTPKDFEKFLDNSPFVKPKPPAPPSRPRPPSRPVAPRPVAKSDRAAETRLRGAIVIGENPEAWLYGKSSDDRLIVRQGSNLDVDDFHAVVRDILADHVLLEHEGFLWRLDLGESLRSMHKLSEITTQTPDTTVDDTEQPVEAPEPPVVN